MSATWFDNVQLVFPGEAIRAGSLLVVDGAITCVDPQQDTISTEAARIDGQGRLLSPGLIDLHIHGIHTALFEMGPEQLCEGLQALPAYGVTTVLPTVIPRLDPGMESRLAQLVAVLTGPADGAKAPGLHLEGPFVALPGAGCRPMPGDVGLLDALLDACGGRVSAMSLSPDTPGILPVIEHLCERGVVPFITHTAATVEQTWAAIAAGARHATHFYDVFPLPPETDPGVRPAGAVEAILADPRVSVDVIADGIHVHPVAIQAACAAKGFERLLLITDAAIGAGLPPGTYPTPWGFPVDVSPARGARIAAGYPNAGGLAGSALTMDVGLRNLLAWLPQPPAQTWSAATRNPAQLLGLPNGALTPGAPADLVLWNPDLTPSATWVAGALVYSTPE